MKTDNEAFASCSVSVLMSVTSETNNHKVVVVDADEISGCVYQNPLFAWNHHCYLPTSINNPSSESYGLYKQPQLCCSVVRARFEDLMSVFLVLFRSLGPR